MSGLSACLVLRNQQLSGNVHAQFTTMTSLAQCHASSSSTRVAAPAGCRRWASPPLPAPLLVRTPPCCPSQAAELFSTRSFVLRSSGGGGGPAAAPRQRRRRQSSSSSGSSSSSRPPQQRQQQQRRTRPPAYDDEYEPGSAAWEEDDEPSLDPKVAARLRKLLKQQGRDAITDSSGLIKAPLLEEAGLLDGDGGDAAAAGAGAGSSSSSSGGGGGGSRSAEAAPAAAKGGRQRLFDASALQAPAPGSQGTLPALPIVRPSSSADADGSSGSGSGGPRQQQQQQQQRQQRQQRPGGGRGGGRAPSFFSSASWQQLGASPSVVDALQSLGISRPSNVQAEAFSVLLPRASQAPRHVALADQAGSGKTLAYLLPLLQQLKAAEAAAGGPSRVPCSPALIIMTPTTELAQQVGRVVRALSSVGLRVRSAVMTGGQGEAERRSKTFRTQCDLLAEGVDVLVSTPGRLAAHLEKGSLALGATSALVLDEVDVLAGGEVSYGEHVAPLRAAGPASMRCVLVSATLPQHTFDELQELFPGLAAAFGPGLHRTSSGLVEELVDCSGGDEVSLESGTARKLDAMMEAIGRVNSPRTIVFCNKIETCRVVENAIKRRAPDTQVLAYHEAVREEARASALTSWLSPPSAGAPAAVLVCTDRTSRGIDSMWCGHVVLFEFPRDPSEYVRRVGRTARGAGGRGVVTVLVLGKQVPLARDILARNRDGAPVHRVPRLWSDA